MAFSESKKEILLLSNFATTYWGEIFRNSLCVVASYDHGGQ